MRVECQSCHGTYDTLSADQVPYYHACPPLSVVEIRAAIAAGPSPLSKAQAAALATADALPIPQVNNAPGVPPGDAYLATLTLERPNKRDENIDPGKVKAAPKDAFGNVAPDVLDTQIMKSVGAGILEVIPVVE